MRHLAVILEDRAEIIRSACMRRTKSTERVARELRGNAKPPLGKQVVDKENKKQLPGEVSHENPKLKERSALRNNGAAIAAILISNRNSVDSDPKLMIKQS